TRLVITYPLTGPYPYGERLRNEFVHDLKENMPRYVIVCKDGGSVTEWGPLANKLTVRLAPIVDIDYDKDAEFLLDRDAEQAVQVVTDLIGTAPLCVPFSLLRPVLLERFLSRETLFLVLRKKGS